LDDQAASLVTAYFDQSRGFAGTTFDTVGENPPGAFTRDDLLALSCLGEHVPPATLRWVMSREGQLDLSRLLVGIPVEVSLGADGDELAFEAAGVAWTFLSGGDHAGVGEVIAGKLLARKRPRLVPIIDRVVRRVVDAPAFGYWDVFREFMRLGPNLLRIDELRRGADAEGVSDLRILDAAVWMRGSGSKFVYPVRDEYGIADLPWSPRP